MPLIAADFNVGIDQAGWLVTLFALTVALAGPPFTLFTQKFNRKQLFIIILALFTIANLGAALAPSLGWLALARIFPALGLPVFWAVATVTAAQMVPKSQQSRAVALIFAGLSAATVLGVPFGTLIGNLWGWRTAFLAIAGLSAATLIGLIIYLSSALDQPKSGLGQQLKILRRKALWIGLLSNSLLLAGMFTSYTYLAEFLEQVTHLEGHLISLMLLLFGAMGLLGNWLAGQGLDRNPLRTTRLIIVSLALITALTIQAGSSFHLMLPILLI